MKTLKKPLILVSTMICAILLLSWTLLDDYRVPSSAASWSSNSPLSDEELLTYMTESNDVAQDELPPAAEDVLVQRIPGDDRHLLLMAYYSKENFARPSFTIENGFTITFTDDGNGVDKKAGDGFYTATIPVDVKAFKKQALSMAQQMRAGGYKPMRYLHRELVYDPDAAGDFEVKDFDANQPVSISGVTNLLSAGSSLDGSSSSITTKKVAVTGATTLDSIRKNCELITDLSVVEDSTRTWNFCTQTGNPNGPWTFGTLMRQLASKNPLQIATDAEVSDYVKNWLNNWAITQVVNGDTLTARTQVNSKILNPWLTNSKNAGAPSGQLDMRFAPFKLTAIVNRFDLRDGKKFSVPGSPCGEGRFVFCLIKSNCTGTLQMTVIFEYGISRPATCESRKDWALQWVNLKNYQLGSSQYNEALQNITDQFSLCGTNPLKPNQSSLNQLRTNEVALAPTSDNPKRWELREFILDSATGNLVQNTVGQTPADKYDAQTVNADVQRMVSYVKKNQKAIKAGKYIVPSTWKGFPFLGGKSRVNGLSVGNPPKAYYWDGTDSTSMSTYIPDNDARGLFSLETCSGCHAGETQTAFTHVDTAFFGQEAGLSGFLTGKAGAGGGIDFDNDSTNNKMTVKDPALRPLPSSPKMRSFNDLKGRAADLNSFVSTTCGSVLSISSQLMFQPTTMVH